PPSVVERAPGAIPRPALKCRSHKKSLRSSRPEKKCARGLIRKLSCLLVKHSLNNPHTFWFRHCQRHRQRFGRHGEHEERRGETSRPWRIRQMGEKAPQPREDDGRLSLLPILTERVNRTFSISVRLTTRSGKSFTVGFGIGWKIRLTGPNKGKRRFFPGCGSRRPMIHFIKFYQIVL